MSTRNRDSSGIHQIAVPAALLDVQGKIRGDSVPSSRTSTLRALRAFGALSAVSLVLVGMAGCGNQENSQRTTVSADPGAVAEDLQMAGVARCLAAVMIMSTGFAQDPSVAADGPEIRLNGELLEFYKAARSHLIDTMRNPAVGSAIDEMFRRQGEGFVNVVKYQGWDTFLPEYQQCADAARR